MKINKIGHIADSKNRSQPLWEVEHPEFGCQTPNCMIGWESDNASECSTVYCFGDDEICHCRQHLNLDKKQMWHFDAILKKAQCYGPNGDGENGPCPHYEGCRVRHDGVGTCEYRSCRDFV
jgi:hypothetical protein